MSAFRVVEATYPDPVRLPVKPGRKLFPGQVVKLVTHEGSTVADLCDGYAALGLIGNRCIGKDNVDLSIIANIYPQRMIADVSKFDKKNEIQTGSTLYCNKKGLLSSKKPFEGAIALAKVITPAGVRNKYMQILWL